MWCRCLKFLKKKKGLEKEIVIDNQRCFLWAYDRIQIWCLHFTDINFEGNDAHVGGDISVDDIPKEFLFNWFRLSEERVLRNEKLHLQYTSSKLDCLQPSVSYPADLSSSKKVYYSLKMRGIIPNPMFSRITIKTWQCDASLCLW